MNKTVIFLFACLMLQGVSGLLNIAKQMCKYNDYSYIATIVSQETWTQIQTMALEFCGGSVIDLKWVLTASSCIEKLKETHRNSEMKFSIVAGFDAALKNFQSQLMKACFPFKTFTSGKGGARAGSPRHDIALIELEQPFQQGPTLRPIKIATTDLSAKCKKAETVSPFAVTETKGGSRFLKTTMELICRAVDIAQPDSCTSVWSWMKLAKDTFCGEKISKWRKKRGSEQPSVCTVAVGSPLVCDDVLIGVETGCKQNGARSAASVYAKIDHYLDFIASTLRNNSINPQDDKKTDDQKKTTTTVKPSSSGAGFLQEAVQKTNLLLITGAVLFVYF